jgi:hypothetical protein
MFIEYIVYANNRYTLLQDSGTDGHRRQDHYCLLKQAFVSEIVLAYLSVSFSAQPGTPCRFNPAP